MAQNIKAMRLSLGLTLQEACDRMPEESRVGISSWSRWESGELEPTVKSMEGIMDALKCTPMQLFYTGAQRKRCRNA